jgi:hypothetical protein
LEQLVNMTLLSPEETKKAMLEADLAIPEQTYSPFLDLAKPTSDGKRTYSTIRFLQEPREITASNGWKHIYARVHLLRGVGGHEEGVYTFDLIKVMLQEKVLKHRPLIGKTFEIANIGKVYGHGHPYYDYDVKQI